MKNEETKEIFHVDRALSEEEKHIIIFSEWPHIFKFLCLRVANKVAQISVINWV